MARSELGRFARWLLYALAAWVLFFFFAIPMLRSAAPRQVVEGELVWKPPEQTLRVCDSGQLLAVRVLASARFFWITKHVQELSSPPGGPMLAVLEGEISPSRGFRSGPAVDGVLDVNGGFWIERGSCAARARRDPSAAEQRARDFLALTDAVQSRDRARVEELLGAGVRAAHPPESDATDAESMAALRDPLQDAVDGGDLALVDLLLAHGANPNWQCCSGETALVMAAERGDPAIVGALLDGGADPLRGGDGGPPLVSALWHGHFAVAWSLVGPTARAILRGE